MDIESFAPWIFDEFGVIHLWRPLGWRIRKEKLKLRTVAKAYKGVEGENQNVWTSTHRKNNAGILRYHSDRARIQRPKEHVHKNDKKHVTKRLDNTSPSSTLTIISFTKDV